MEIEMLCTRLLEKLMARRRRVPDLIEDCRRAIDSSVSELDRIDGSTIHCRMLHGFVLHNDEIRGASEPLLERGSSGRADGMGCLHHIPSHERRAVRIRAALGPNEARCATCFACPSLPIRSGFRNGCCG